jgi:hypothetical protein
VLHRWLASWSTGLWLTRQSSALAVCSKGGTIRFKDNWRGTVNYSKPGHRWPGHLNTEQPKMNEICCYIPYRSLQNTLLILSASVGEVRLPDLYICQSTGNFGLTVILHPASSLAKSACTCINQLSPSSSHQSHSAALFAAKGNPFISEATSYTTPNPDRRGTPETVHAENTDQSAPIDYSASTRRPCLLASHIDCTPPPRSKLTRLLLGIRPEPSFSSRCKRDRI